MEEEKKQQQGAGQGNAHGSHHHRHRPRHGHRPIPQNGENATQTMNIQQSNDCQTVNSQQSNPNRNDRNGNRHSHHHGKNRRMDFSGVQQNAEDLAQLRAQIVVKPAEEKPSSFSDPVPAEPKSPVRQEETVAEKTPEELLSSPVTDTRPKTEECVEVVGVQFRETGKSYYFSPNRLKIPVGTPVIVETAKGPEYGIVTMTNRMIPLKDTVQPLRSVIRLADKADTERNEANRRKEKEAIVICRQKVDARGLEMKIMEAQYAFDDSKLLFYFTSEGRVDFRELVKDLAAVFHTRIELRQVGIRDEAKLLGGIGSCGRPICCSGFLPDFAQVSIKMAKEQNLSLNSAKISGNCGRLMCCLHYETESYAMEQKLTPPVGSVVRTADGDGTVTASNLVAGTVKVSLKDSPDAPPKSYHRDTVTVLQRREKPEKTQKSEKNE